MKVFCKICNRIIGTIPDNKVPSGKSVFVRCPKCETKIDISNWQEMELEIEEAVTNFSESHNIESKQTQIRSPQNIIQDQRFSDEFTGGALLSSSNKTNKLNIIAVVFTMLILSSVALRFWAFSQSDKMTGPNRLAFNNDIVIALHNNTFHYLDPDGNLLQKTGLAEFNIRGPVEDFELLQDGTILIGDLHTKAIYHCDSATNACDNIGPTGDIALKKNFKFIVKENQGLVYISDTFNHRLLSLTLADGKSKILKTGLSYPNDMYLGNDETLLLCDSFHFSVLSFKMDGDQLNEMKPPILFSKLDLKEMVEFFQKKKPTAEDIRSHAEKISDDMHDFNFNRPMALARDSNGNLWVVAASESFMLGAEVRLFSPEGEFIRRFDKSVTKCPEDIIKVNDKLLVADTELCKVFKVDTESLAFTEFGDHAFTNILSRDLSKRKMYSFITKWSFVFMFINICLLLVTYIALKKRNRSINIRK